MPPKENQQAEVPAEEKKVAKKGKKGAKTEDPEAPQQDQQQKGQVVLGPQVTGGDMAYAVCHILATGNDTFIHVTDLTGRETLVRVTGGMKVKTDREEPSPYAAMLAANDVIKKLQTLKIKALHIKLRGRGGTGSKQPGPGAQAALRVLARHGMKIGRIEDVTPIPTDSTRRKGGRRGRRL